MGTRIARGDLPRTRTKAPRYNRLRPLPALSAILKESGGQELPDAARPLVAKVTVEIWTLRQTMGLGVGPPPR